MSKVDTDEGLGPGSEDRRREVRKAQDDLDSRSKLKTAETQPGIGKVERKSDTVDDLLDGFGPSRPDLPHRILPKEDTTPPPEPIRRELTPTEPGKRQRLRKMILAAVISFGVIVGIGVVLVRMSGPATTSTAAPPATTTSAAQAVSTVTATATAPQTIAPITTMAVESLPTVATAAPTHSHHIAATHPTTTASPPTTATTTATARPTGTAPPGMNLLPDDPHR
ncbi:MAG TPA: hypothetical protein VGH28_23990 [Polyangiaceae bacterium]